MLFPTWLIIFLSTALVELTLGLVAYSVSASPRWRFGRQFAGLAFTTGVYTIGNSLSLVPDVPAALIRHWTGEVNCAVAGLHVAIWLRYAHSQLGTPSRRWTNLIGGLCALLGLVALIPGVMVAREVVVRETGLGSLTLPTLTSAAPIAAVVWVFGMAVVFAQYARAAWRGSTRATTHAVGIGVFFATAIHEFAISFRLVEGVSSIQFGFAVVVFVVFRDAVAQFANDAEALVNLSASLAEKVEQQAQRLVETNEQLLRAERVSALGVLASSIGHELNNPLSVILTSTEWAKNRLPAEADPAVSEALTDSLEAARRAATIVRDLKVFVTGAPEGRAGACDICEVVDTSIRLVRNELVHRATLHWEPRPIPPVAGDAQHLSQVFVNLLVNAAHSFPPGTVGTPRAEVRVAVEVEGDWVTVTVDDTGSGIPPAVRRRLFEPFFTTKAQGQGTGLGLYVSMGIVRSVGGELTIEDNPSGAGTRVRVRLRLAQAAPTDEASPAPAATTVAVAPVAIAAEGPVRVLLVDDDPAVARVIERSLVGCEVKSLREGRVALAELRERGDSYDVILCDIRMPEISGPEFYDHARRDQPDLARRFLFITGGALEPEAVAFVAAHEGRVLEKPIAPSTLRARVMEFAATTRHARGPGPPAH